MKRKHLFLTLAALVAASGLWFARSTRRTHDSTVHQSSPGVGSETPHAGSEPNQMLNSPTRLAAPDPTRRFRDFTPEQRVEFARKGHGPGG